MLAIDTTMADLPADIDRGPGTASTVHLAAPLYCQRLNSGDLM